MNTVEPMTSTEKTILPLLELWNAPEQLKDRLRNTPITGLSYDSRSTKPGNIFFCIEGEHFDGNNFVADVVAKGAGLVVSQRKESAAPCDNYVVVDDIRLAMAQAARYFYDDPTSKLRVIGVTGTNGKTSTTHIVERILLAAGYKTGLIGTMGARWSTPGDLKKDMLDLHHTTPQCIDFYEVLDTMVKAGVSHVVMEVSSHALYQKRVGLANFAGGCLTNITQDHLDFHKTMENYKEAKAILFSSLKESCHKKPYAVLNADDEAFSEFKAILKDSAIELYSYGFSKEADFRIIEETPRGLGTDIRVALPEGEEDFKLKILGRFNLYNALAGLTIACAEQIDLKTIKEALSKFTGVDGRFEVVRLSENGSKNGSEYPLCIVDYAHTPDGLENVLKAAREVVPEGGKLVVVFGCGGDRDTSKRPQMGAIAERLADRLYVTSDNPRSEEPKQIIADILAGLSRMQNVQVEEDREKSIEQAIQEAAVEDVIVIAGKGHETYQLIKDKVLDFDDRQKVRQGLTKRLS